MSATSSTRVPSGARRQHDPARGAGAGAGVGARQGTIREHNLALLTQQLFGAGIPLSRAALAARTGMTRSTVSRLVDDLLAAGILREEEAVSHGGRGRPAVPLLPARRTLLGLGLEVNVDFLAARALDLSGEVVAEEVVHDDLRGSDPTQVLARTGDLARAVARRAGRTGGRVVASALALPGLVQRGSGRLLLAPNLGWTDVDPLAGLGDTDGLGDVVAVVNEADAGAMAATRPRRNGPQLPPTFLYVSAQVGIGAATVSRGVVEAGTHGWAGEIGHVAVVPDGPRCRCGATGCLEQYAGKEALAEAAGLPPTAEAEELLEVALRDGAAGEPARAALDRAA
uniref:ROK family transcriptional regulator n=1 Tax=Ornithinicoccus halotolerans TaxID=1748220 RepID=UPI001297B164